MYRYKTPATVSRDLKDGNDGYEDQEAGRCRKRQRLLDHPPASNELVSLVQRTNNHATTPNNWTDASSYAGPAGDDESWSNQAFFAVGMNPASFKPGRQIEDTGVDYYTLKFAEGRTAWDLSIRSLAVDQEQNIQPSTVTSLLYPDLPSVAEREVNPGLLNPFDENGKSRHRHLRAVVKQPKGGEVNSYIKVRFQPNEEAVGKDTTATTKLVLSRRRKTMAMARSDIIPLLPPNFGRTLKLDPDDDRLLKFCRFIRLLLLYRTLFLGCSLTDRVLAMKT